MSKANEQCSSSVAHPSVFFGYDLLEYVTPDDIISFMVKYKHTIVDVEVVLNERCGNYAKITVLTPSDAQTMMKYYSGKYWRKYNLTVTLKPWKEKLNTKPLKKCYQEMLVHAAGDMIVSDDSYKSARSSTHSTSEPPYEGLDKIKSGHELEFRKPQKRIPDCSFNKGQFSKEYSIKLSGLKLNVKEKKIFDLVKHFGYLVRPVRIARYPENGICYAYVDYSSRHSAMQAVQELDEIEFDGTKIHVCHRSGLGVAHSCKNKLHALLSADSPNPHSRSSVTRENDVIKVEGAKEMGHNTSSHNVGETIELEIVSSLQSDDGHKSTELMRNFPYMAKPEISSNMVVSSASKPAAPELEIPSHIQNKLQNLAVPYSTESLSEQYIPNDISFSSLTVGNIHPGISVQEIEMHLKSYGSLAAPLLTHYDDDSDSYSAVVQYVSVEDSMKVVTKLNGSFLNGYQLHVSKCTNNMSGSRMTKNDEVENIENHPITLQEPLEQIVSSRTNDKGMKLSSKNKKGSTAQ